MTQTTDLRKIILILGVMVSGGFITMLNQTVLTPALPSIMAEMDVTANVGQWLTTVFLLVSSVMIPLTAFFIDKFTTRQLFIGAMGIFAVGSYLCASSGSFAVILFGRILQAAGAGIMMPLSQTVTMLMVPREKRGTAMGIIGLVMGLAPAIGPTLSGWVIDVFNWHLMFYVIFVLAIIDIILSCFVLQNATKTGNPKLDIPSVIYSSLGLSLFLFGCSSAGDLGLVNPVTLLCLAAGIAFTVVFTRRQLALDVPFLNLRVLRHREFAIATIIVMVLNASLVSGTVLLPIFMQNIQGYTAMQSGLVMLPGAICMAIFNLASGYIFDKQGPRKLAICGIFMLTVSAFAFGQFQAGTPFAVICIIYTLRTTGIALAMMPITTWGLNTLANSQMAHGTAINSTLRQVAGSFGTSFFVAVMTAFAATRADQGYAVSNLYGIHVAFDIISALCLLSLLLTLLFIKDAPKTVAHKKTGLA